MGQQDADEGPPLRSAGRDEADAGRRAMCCEREHRNNSHTPQPPPPAAGPTLGRLIQILARKAHVRPRFGPCRATRRRENEIGFRFRVGKRQGPTMRKMLSAKNGPVFVFVFAHGKDRPHDAPFSLCGKKRQKEPLSESRKGPAFCRTSDSDSVWNQHRGGANTHKVAATRPRTYLIPQSQPTHSLFRHDVHHQRRTPPSPQYQRQHERQEKNRRSKLHAGRSVCRGIGVVQVLLLDVFFFFVPVPTFAISDIFGNFGRPHQYHSFCYHRYHHYQFNQPKPRQWQRKDHIDVGSPSQAAGVPSRLVSSRRTVGRIRTTLRRKSPRCCCCRTNKKDNSKAPPQTDRCVPVLLPRAVPRNLQARKQQRRQCR